MPKYKCYGKVVGSKYLGEVVADSVDEAKRAATHLPSVEVSLCHQCDDECGDPEVQEITVEEA